MPQRRFKIAAAALVPVGSPAFAQAPSPFPPGRGADLVAQHCTQCHAADVITNSGKSREEWQTTVSTMVGMGAAIPEAEFNTVVDYLAKSFPPK